MKILPLVLLLMASMAFVLVGCSDNSAPLVAPTEQALSTPTSSATLGKGCAVAGSVVGKGRCSVSGTGANAGFLDAVTFAFDATEYKNGTCRGEYEMDYLLDNRVTLVIKGKIKGIKFYGNVAMFWGEVQTPFLIDIFGKQLWRQIFVVTDNGKHKRGIPDRMSNPALTTDGVWPGEFNTLWALNAEDFLASLPASMGTGSDYPLTRGDIQVKEMDKR
jgi:hypothetical protein